MKATAIFTFFLFIVGTSYTMQKKESVEPKFKNIRPSALIIPDQQQETANKLIQTAIALATRAAKQADQQQSPKTKEKARQLGRMAARTAKKCSPTAQDQTNFDFPYDK